MVILFLIDGNRTLNGNKCYSTYFAVQRLPRKQQWSVQKRKIKKGKLHATPVVRGKRKLKQKVNYIQQNKNLGKECSDFC